MPRMTKARQAAISEARKAQKRARDKEYSLRRRGAAMIGEYSPREQWAAVEAMTTKEIRAYTKRLANFSSKRVAVLESGELLDEAIIKRINRNIAEHNRKAARERAKIDKVRAQLPEVGERFIKSKASVGVDPNTLQPYVDVEVGVTGSSLMPIKQTELPKNLTQAMRRLKKSEQWAKPNYRKQYATQRNTAAKMLRLVYLDDVASEVEQMSDLAFSVAVNRYGLFDELEVWYTDDVEVLDWQISNNRAEYEGFTQRMRDMVSALAEL